MTQYDGSAPCSHEVMIWGPLQFEYNSEGTADVWQEGVCQSCGAKTQLSYAQPGMGEATPEIRAQKTIREIEDLLVNQYEEGTEYTEDEVRTLIDAIVDVIDRHNEITRVSRPKLSRAQALETRRLHSLPPVQAEIHSDDHRAASNFLANRWLSEASDEEIRLLARIHWSGDTAADEVALFMESIDLKVELALDYCRTAVQINEEPIGFEVSVNSEEAMKWLDVHRPTLAAQIRAEGDLQPFDA